MSSGRPKGNSRLNPKGVPVRLGTGPPAPKKDGGISSRGSMAKKTEPPAFGGPNVNKRTGR
jgi:hypothetical protein